MSKNDDEEELVIIETLPEDDDEDKQQEAYKEPPENDDDDEDDDDKLSSRDKEQDDEKQRRRRESAQERKQRRAEAIKRDKLELSFLRQQNENLERRVALQEQRTHQIDVNSYDAQIQQARQAAEQAERIIAKAIAAGEGNDATEAFKYRDQALQRANELAQRKQMLAQQALQKQQQQQAPAINPMVQRYAQDFVKDNPWYDVDGRDEDSAIVRTIDNTLFKEGYDPASSEYWAELKKRVARRIPERFAPPKAREPRGGPAVGNGREYTPPSTRKEVYISPERKQALVLAGVWDDPVLRNKYVKRYMDYDKENKK